MHIFLPLQWRNTSVNEKEEGQQLACKLYWYPYTQYIGEDDKNRRGQKGGRLTSSLFSHTLKSSHLRRRTREWKAEEIVVEWRNRGRRKLKGKELVIYRPASSDTSGQIGRHARRERQSFRQSNFWNQRPINQRPNSSFSSFFFHSCLLLPKRD